MLPGLSGIPAAGEERVPDGDAGQAATTASPRLRAMLRSRARTADRIAEGLLKVLDQTDAVADEAKQRIHGSVASSVADVAPISPGGASSTTSTATPSSCG